MTVRDLTPDRCPMCHRIHEEWEPHDAQSIAYQIRFFFDHGRYPTWKDAMAHSPDIVKAAWTEELFKHGVAVE